MGGPQVLVLSADAERARPMVDALRRAGYDVVSRIDAGQVAADLQAGSAEALVIDLRLVGLDHVGLVHSLAPAGPELSPEPLDEVERRHIHAMLLHTGGNKRRAAQLLGIARSTLIQKVRRYGIDAPGHRGP